MVLCAETGSVSLIDARRHEKLPYAHQIQTQAGCGNESGVLDHSWHVLGPLGNLNSRHYP